MAYQDKDQEFLPDFHSARDLVKAKFGEVGLYKPVDPEVAWKAYSNSKEKTDANKSVLGLMLFGRHLGSMKQEVAKKAQADFSARQQGIDAEDERLRGTWYVPKPYRAIKTNAATNASYRLMEKEKKNVPASIDTDKNSAIMKNFGVVNNEHSGSILLMGSDNWNFTINDCWLLGAVHSHLPFYPASAVSEANIFDDKHVLSITGRELYGLAIFGYRHSIGHPSIGSVFEVQNPGKATGATLKAYQQAMNDLTKAGALNAFKDAGFQIAKIGF